MCALLANPLSTRCAPKGQNYEILAVPREGRLRALRLHAAPFLPSLIIILSTELSPGILGPSYLGSRSPGKSCLPGVCFVPHLLPVPALVLCPKVTSETLTGLGEFEELQCSAETLHWSAAMDVRTGVRIETPSPKV